ncbi:penicillin-binding protein 2, partial [Acidobacteriota bacterium]
PPKRGIITDRNGIILANNIASFNASIIRENCKNLDESCQKIARLLNLEPGLIKERIREFDSWPIFKPIVIKDDLTHEEVSRIEARKMELPELIIQVEPKRYYPFGTFAAHVIGYLQELSQAEIKTAEYEEKRLGDLIGKTGVEKQYDSLLAGYFHEIVDSEGRAKEELKREPPIKGKNIRLTIDFDLQQEAERLLEGREGAVVVLSPKSGEILALASFPNYNPNKFITHFTHDEWLEIVNSPEFPLENRAIRGVYAPGSVFKLTMALGALDLRMITDRTVHFCSGSTRIYGHLFSCGFKPGHGRVNLFTAIRHSCNIYFYQVGKNMGIEEISRYGKILGFGSKTGVDLPGEKEGLVPNSKWKRENRKEPWYPGETISVSIGQGALLVTPLQIAVHTSLIANRGAKITPHLFHKNSLNSDLSGREEKLVQENSTGINQASFEKVIKGMWESVNESGTSRATRIEGYDICGKTGSTQTVSTETAEKFEDEGKTIKTHSWFSGFAPRDDPKIVVTIIVEYGGAGGQMAAPFAKNLIEVFREKYDR